MPKHLRKRPSPSMAVALLALFIALSGTTYAATGGNFILGQANSAGATTKLTSGVTTGPTLDLANTGNRTAAKFTANPGKSPFAVSNSQKITNLNADLLDGLDSGSFMQGVGSRTFYARRTMTDASQATLLDLGWMLVYAECVGGFVSFHMLATPSADLDVASSAFGYKADVRNERAATFGAAGGVGTIQVGQTYRPGGVGFPRTRLATFVVSGNADGTNCRVQVEAFAQE